MAWPAALHAHELPSAHFAQFLMEIGRRQPGGHEMPRSKLAPDVYLAAVAHLGAAGSRCLVIEDTTTGVTAGATVWA